MNNADFTIEVLKNIISNYERDLVRLPEVYGTPTYVATIEAYKYALKLLTTEV